MNSMSDNPTWKQWKESEEGQKCLDPGILKNDDQIEYLENRLWRAFHAGDFPIKVKLETDIEALLNECLCQPTLKASFRRKIKTYLSKP